MLEVRMHGSEEGGGLATSLPYLYPVLLELIINCQRNRLKRLCFVQNFAGRRGAHGATLKVLKPGNAAPQSGKPQE